VLVGEGVIVLVADAAGVELGGTVVAGGTVAAARGGGTVATVAGTCCGLSAASCSSLQAWSAWSAPNTAVKSAWLCND